ncbi:unnamed protein product [Polarella glacialis]|uniref:Uncharacterized protein n=2 Tax=Polarella glacialis TaxID=89957 RepID=A0A813FGP2_POLGL|nr:unnamed protein product [Polarella glacialis]
MAVQSSSVFVLPSSSVTAPNVFRGAPASSIVAQAEPSSHTAGSSAQLLGVATLGVTLVAAKGARRNNRAAKSRAGLRASTEEVLRKGGMGSVYGDVGVSSAPSGGGSKSAPVSSGDLGVQEPVGYWDPLGLNVGADAATFARRRTVEIKHGRVAMYATMGYITPQYFKFDGYLSPSLGIKFSDVPNGLAAISKVPLLGWAQIIFFIGLVENTGFFQKIGGIGFQKDVTMAGTPGDYGVGFPNFIGKVADPVEKKTKLNAELANGRLAMMAIIGMFFQDGLTGSAWGDWALYTASPLRASTQEVLRKGGMGSVYGDVGGSSAPSGGGSKSAPVSSGDLGVQEPVGYWDPLGLNVGADAATFARRRTVEIKHGRVAMYATMGYITPQYFKFDGYLSPSLGIKFSDVPNGLAAISKVPLLGWAQIVFFIGLVENTGFFQKIGGIGFQKDVTMAGTPGDYGVGFPNFIGKVADPVEKKTKLNAELANGRLAMMAIIGMFFQDGLTGSAWGDWALYTASPLRAVSDEKVPDVKKAPPPPPPFNPALQIGSMPPMDFWDPAGFVKVGDKPGFNKMRAAEIKHGRVAMMAALGMVAQCYFHFPGFEEVPNGIGAVALAPGTYGLGAIFVISGVLELFVWTEDDKKEPGNFGDPAGLNQYNEDMRAKEINNGRMAMFSIIGILGAEAVSGKDAIGQFGNGA